LFIYVNATRAERREVKAFARYFVRKARELSGRRRVGADDGDYTLAEQRLGTMSTGTMFTAGLGVEYLLAQ
jgi:hypothetical protein